MQAQLIRKAQVSLPQRSASSRIHSLHGVQVQRHPARCQRVQTCAFHSLECGLPRRNLLLGGTYLFLLQGISSGASAEDKKPELPKDYVKNVTDIVTSLRDSLALEDSTTEAEVRRKAEPAKEHLREFVKKWRDDANVRGTVSHSAIKSVLVELGDFYKKNGSRAKLSPDVKASVLAHLTLAEAALPTPIVAKKPAEVKPPEPVVVKDSKAAAAAIEAPAGPTPSAAPEEIPPEDATNIMDFCKYNPC